MNKPLLNYLIAAVMLASALAAIAMKPATMLSQSRAVNIQNIIPSEFGTWRELPGQSVIEISPEAQAGLDRIYNQLVSRTYVNAQGQRVMLSVAYGEDQRDGMGMHRPEACYPAQGFTISSRKEGVLAIGPKNIRVTRLVAQINERIEPVTYWTLLGEKNTLGGRDSKYEQIKYGLRGIIPDGLIFRVSTIGNESNAEYDIQAQFVEQLFDYIGPKSTSLLAGGV
ncbi:exosortase-associated protein EpsI, B-type [Chitinolyticbacter albus]|uniref:exosortase-associated protein EpsI, B-type n=1 Tax=Chitinolyticbacter albus TaxID=2961951 RepID=UPI00210AD885|nr:exosortase-associated protein EpsI, B-type [Chitinolyticbacter albus]